MTDPEVIRSLLSRSFTLDNVTVEIEIYRLGDRPGWALEVVNDRGTSTVWEETFETEDDAEEAFRQVIEDEGIEAFLDDHDEDEITLH